MTSQFRRLTASATVGLAILLFCTSSGLAQTTALYLESQPGDFIGQGQTRTWTPADLQFFALETGGSRRSVSLILGTADTTSWFLAFAVPGPEVVPGVYENATGSSQTSNVSPRLNIVGQSGGCNASAGRFVVYEVAFGAGGAVTSFAADFEQHCEGVTPALFGAIRYNSSRASLVPFDGVYPVYSLRIEPAVNGTVIGPGIACGAGSVDCEESYPPDAVVPLQAVASPGFVFLGWAGDCAGDEDAIVSITWRRFCAPVFNRLPGGGVESPDYSQEAFFLDGAVGSHDVEIELPSNQRPRRAYVALGVESPNRSAVTLGTSFTNAAGLVHFDVEGPRGVKYELTFASPTGTNLTPGTEYSYTSTVLASGSQVPVLQFSRVGIVGLCGGGGRFLLHEFTFDQATGSVTRFAADFEVPCGLGLVAGSLRYRSTRSSLLPFDGQYPRYGLQVVPTLGGQVTSTGIDCGGGSADCEETYEAPTQVALQAVPSPGYRFLAWGGACSGSVQTTTVAVDRGVQCFAAFAATPSGGQFDDSTLATALFLDWLDLAGDSRIVFGDDARVSAWGSDQNASATFSSNLTIDSTTVFFGALTGSLVPGEYVFQYAPQGRFIVTGCHVRMARYRIYEKVLDVDGRVLKFAADFEALCDFPARHVAGAVRVNSSRASILPFGGLYPAARLTLQPAINGIVQGPGFDCGPGRTACAQTFAGPTTVTLQAVALPGYRFVGWSGNCDGTSAITLIVEWFPTCTAVFNAVIPGLVPEDPRLSARGFFIDSQVGDQVGKGRRHVWIDDDIKAAAVGGRRWLSLTMEPPDRQTWYVALRATLGQELRPGVYENATDVYGPTASPGLRITGMAGSCSNQASAVGRFVVHEITFASSTSTTVTSFAADFEQRCHAGAPALRGSIRFQSGRAVLTPFAPTVFTPAPLPLAPDVNRDGWGDLIWRHTTTGRNAVWLTRDFDAIATMSLEPSSAAAVVDLAWEIRAVSDMNGDGSPDLIWQHDTTGRMAIWFMSGQRLASSNYLYTAAQSSIEPDLNWKIVAAGDTDRDGQTDLLWRHQTSGQMRLWHMNGIVQWDSVSLPTVADVNWEIAGLADMNQDGMLDIVWRHYGHGGIATWFMYDALVQATVRLSDLADTTWRIAGVADMNRDGKADLVWQNTVSGGIAVWLMDGIATIGGRYLNPSRVADPGWRIAGVR